MVLISLRKFNLYHASYWIINPATQGWARGQGSRVTPPRWGWQVLLTAACFGRLRPGGLFVGRVDCGGLGFEESEDGETWWFEKGSCNMLLSVAITFGSSSDQFFFSPTKSFQTSGVESSPHNMPQHDRIRNYNHQSPLATHRQRTVSGWRMRNFRNQDGSCLTLGWSQSPSSQLGWCKLGRFWHPNSESVGFQSLQGVTRECTPRKSGVLEPCWNLSLLACKAGLMCLWLQSRRLEMFLRFKQDGQRWQRSFQGFQHHPEIFWWKKSVQW